MKYYLGIDGGGTRTTAAVSDENGNVLFKAVGKSINFYSVGMEKARENLENVINDILLCLVNVSLSQFCVVFLNFLPMRKLLVDFFLQFFITFAILGLRSEKSHFPRPKNKIFWRML